MCQSTHEVYSGYMGKEPGRILGTRRSNPAVCGLDAPPLSEKKSGLPKCVNASASHRPWPLPFRTDRTAIFNLPDTGGGEL